MLAVTCVILIGVVFIGTGFESKMQLGLLIILGVSIINYFVGTFITPSIEKQAEFGLTGYSCELKKGTVVNGIERRVVGQTLRSNLLPEYSWEKEKLSAPTHYDFFLVFAVYFPAATGIMAGANISGDLANPQVSQCIVSV